MPKPKPKVAAQGSCCAAPPASEPARSATVGRWDPVFELPNVAVHMSLLPNKKVLFWGRRYDRDGSMDEHECTPYVLDPGTRECVATPQPALHDRSRVNLFCAGHAFLPDGRLLVVGGHIRDGFGLAQACAYDFRSNTWEPLPRMKEGRWYPTVTALADGTMLVTGGSITTDAPNDIAEVWDGLSWQGLVPKVVPLYPRMHLIPDGRVFMSGSNAESYFFDAGASGAWVPLGGPQGSRQHGERQYAPSVMYDVGKIAYFGGGLKEDSVVPTSAAEVIDLTEEQPRWRPAGSMRFRRRHHNATILPDGTILITGGTQGPGFNNLDPGEPIHEPELWTPSNGAWTVLAGENVDRCYHGTALLLPDATVLSAGSGEAAGIPDKHNHRNAQIFQPPYLFLGERPAIEEAPEAVNYGEEFALRVSGPEVVRGSWIRLGSVTHSFDQNQRIIPFEARSSGGRLRIVTPERSAICPPGHYMLFVISAAGVPSRAPIVRIGSAQAERRADAGAYIQYASIQERDAEIRGNANGTKVTLGLTAHCPYGLGACWAGAYEGLKQLEGVSAIPRRPNAEDSTADVYLQGNGLPPIDRWPAQFASTANGSYIYRGLEVELKAKVRREADGLKLFGAALETPVTVRPFESSVKIQWDLAAGAPKPASAEELAAYHNLERETQARGAPDLDVSVTGPLTREAGQLVLYLREFRVA